MNAANALPSLDTAVTVGQVNGIRDTLYSLFELPLGGTYTTGFDLGKRLTDVSNIFQPLSDLSVLHTDSLAAGSLQALLDNLTK